MEKWVRAPSPGHLDANNPLVGLVPYRWRRSDYPGGLEIVDAHHSPMEKWRLLVAGETEEQIHAGQPITSKCDPRTG